MAGILCTQGKGELAIMFESNIFFKIARGFLIILVP